ncbi:Holliday junction branch migration protein RuvA [Vandammella animalimorsus]|uniref:Holliday junction branch migration complex subunit RuvA n=1 Tax=Vandammella animalimorsus TaxID=2029117 RepID=A0A2A2T6R0_9BURK|nr:Holliday junction branch migration protein RuvA [Vandammella animalimorsus]PAT32948.1 Holliday junction branch migration protein RuvA [Vandammella animalimorsus]PAX17360.1 Holliday junction branch migration protein RuvA [Vandammella animalimorsus]PAX19416.1 Holliday junction branch migration protein RuvA [Vandammella animalimorsus]
MIGKLTGTLAEKNPPHILIDCQGVGYEVLVSMNTFYHLPALGERVSLATQLIVREDAHLLYGFGSAQERSCFRELIKVSGLGPKTALAVLSGLTVQELAAAIAQQELGRLTRIPGIGKKTAERLLLELKGKIGDAADASLPAAAGQQASPEHADILQALLALGYSDKEAQQSLKNLPNAISVSEGIRFALKSLSK